VQAIVSLDSAIPYTGAELRSLWAYETFGTPGDTIVLFAGPCSVATERLVDTADRLAGETIEAACMLHIIIEHFDDSLECAVLRQRLLIAIIKDELASLGVKGLLRRGDDLYRDERKLTVSIATRSPVSTLIHTGINIDPAGAPVPACGLAELGVDHRALAEQVAEAYLTEVESAAVARAKVRGVP
jgi:hypothetical protein